MKLKFTKNETIVNVCFIDKGDSTSEFSYIEMVKRLFEDREAEEPEFEGEFTDEEKSSIISLISDIKEKCFVPENADNIKSEDISSSMKSSDMEISEQSNDFNDRKDDLLIPFDL